MCYNESRAVWSRDFIVMQSGDCIGCVENTDKGSSVKQKASVLCIPMTKDWHVC